MAEQEHEDAVSRERRRRARQTWAHLAATEAEARAAFRRFSSREGPARGRSRTLALPVLAVLVMSGVAFGAPYLASSWRPFEGASEGAFETGGPSLPAVAPTRRAATAPPQVVAEGASAEEEPPVAPVPVHEPPKPAPVAVEPRGLARPSAARAPAVPAPPPTLTSPAALWAAAAEALRTNDKAAAERSLDALARVADPRTRDAARLARSQLWLSEGNVGAARADLTSLATTGATPYLRKQAADELRGVEGAERDAERDGR